MHPTLRSALDQFIVKDGHPDILLRCLDRGGVTPHDFALSDYPVPQELRIGYRAGFSDPELYNLWKTYRRAIATRLRAYARSDG